MSRLQVVNGWAQERLGYEQLPSQPDIPPPQVKPQPAPAVQERDDGACGGLLLVAYARARRAIT